jgi:asparagine synthetase B (glutamine-hydrolysing)
MPRHQVVALSMRLPVLRRPLLEFFQFTQSGKAPQGLAGKALAWTAFRGSTFSPPRIAGAAEATVVAEPRDLNRYLAESAANMSSVHYTEPMAEQSLFAFRAPYLDPDAVDLSLSIPMPHKIGWRKQKLVLRDAFAGLLPDHVTKRPKTIHRLQHDVILSDALDDMANECGNLESVRRRSLVDTGYLNTLQRREAGKPYSTDRLYRLWTLVSLEIWLRQFLDGGGQYWTFIA